MKRKIEQIYRKLYQAFGPQHWWPGETVFEIIVGSILTQSTSWHNVEKAINALKKKKLLNARSLYLLPKKRLASLIKSSGYYNIKAQRLKNFLVFFFNRYGGKQHLLSRAKTEVVRKQLLEIKGVGQETADSILLYALGKPVFVVDSYTKRIFSRHGLASAETDYQGLQDIFMRNLKPEAKLFNEYHALLVKTAKDYCRKHNPKCEICPLWSIKKG